VQKALLGLTLFLFGVLTAITLWHHGYTGVVMYQMQTFAGQQVFSDLSIALTLIMVWMFQDARNLKRNPWGWIALTVFLGSFGPLLYLITRRP
jgi:hypothetical protein